MLYYFLFRQMIYLCIFLTVFFYQALGPLSGMMRTSGFGFVHGVSLLFCSLMGGWVDSTPSESAWLGLLLDWGLEFVTPSHSVPGA